MAIFTTAVRTSDVTDANTSGSSTEDQSEVTTFVTQQSLTFPVSVTIIGLLRLGAQALGTWGESNWIPLGLSVLIVLIALLSSWDEIKGASKKGAAIGLAFLNAGLLFVGSIGIDLTGLGSQLNQF